jgi:hypothetical protein
VLQLPLAQGLAMHGDGPIATSKFPDCGAVQDGGSLVARVGAGQWVTTADTMAATVHHPHADVGARTTISLISLGNYITATRSFSTVEKY